MLCSSYYVFLIWLTVYFNNPEILSWWFQPVLCTSSYFLSLKWSVFSLSQKELLNKITLNKKSPQGSPITSYDLHQQLKMKMWRCCFSVWMRWFNCYQISQIWNYWGRKWGIVEKSWTLCRELDRYGVWPMAILFHKHICLRGLFYVGTCFC